MTQLGKWDYENRNPPRNSIIFSVSIFQWQKCKTIAGIKPSRVVLRIAGYTGQYELVSRTAKTIVRLLNESGLQFTDVEHVKAKRYFADTNGATEIFNKFIEDAKR